MAAPTLDELPACPVETTLTIIRSKWQVLILRDLLLNGTMRFKELQRSIGKVSQKVLTDNLRAMEDYGIVRREVFAEVPPRVEYSLTDTGLSLRTVLDAMWAWGEGYKDRLRSEGR
jgi:DNA-binding HxlR family transcriptional regulator